MIESFCGALNSQHVNHKLSISNSWNGKRKKWKWHNNFVVCCHLKCKHFLLFIQKRKHWLNHRWAMHSNTTTCGWFMSIHTCYFIHGRMLWQVEMCHTKRMCSHFTNKQYHLSDCKVWSILTLSWLQTEFMTETMCTKYICFW